MSNVLEFQRVSKSYFGKEVLLEADMTVREGDFVFLIGPTGIGKTTTIRLSYLDEKPDKGRVIVLGQDARGLKRRDVQVIRRKIGVIFQDFKLLTDRSVLDNVSFGLELVGVRSQVARQRAEEALSEVGLADRAGDDVQRLSGGEKQRVAIARALVREPLLLLADEPTGNLDPEATARVVETLRYANEVKGTTVLFATHNHNLLEAVPKARVFFIEAGKIEEVKR
ncbi:MAG: ATP-binding cassette domain-containing protein [candidate division WOR-3 bacterium]